MCQTNIEQYNQVNQKTAVKPNYDLSMRETSIKLYFNNDGNVVIIGVVDNNYIHWASLTRIDNIEVNEPIFNHIANEGYTYVSHEYYALESNGIVYGDLKSYYVTRLYRDDKNGHAWHTPFGHGYGNDQIENNGRYFARDVKCYLGVLQQRCRIREGNGEYANLLKQYKEALMETDYMAYESQVKPIRDLLEHESYFVLSQNDEINKLYLECTELISDSYNAYMTAVR